MRGLPGSVWGPSWDHKSWVHKSASLLHQRFDIGLEPWFKIGIEGRCGKNVASRSKSGQTELMMVWTILVASRVLWCSHSGWKPSVCPSRPTPVTWEAEQCKLSCYLVSSWGQPWERSQREAAPFLPRHCGLAASLYQRTQLPSGSPPCMPLSAVLHPLLSLAPWVPGDGKASVLRSAIP